MVQHARRPVQTDHHAHYQKPCRDDAEGIFVGEANGEDGGGEFPRRGIEGVGEPVGYQSVDGPFPVEGTNGVKIWGMLDRVVGRREEGSKDMRRETGE